VTISITKNGYDKTYDLECFAKDVVSFGRSPECDIVIEKTYVSRVHGCFFKEKGKWFIQDLESVNGIIFEGKKIQGKRVMDFMAEFVLMQQSEPKDQIVISVL